MNKVFLQVICNSTLNWGCDVCASCLVSCMPVIDTCERGSTYTALNYKYMICNIAQKLPIVCKKQCKWHLMTKFCSVFLVMFFLSPTIITCFHSGHATSWSVIAGIPHFLRNLINEIVLFGFDLFYSKCIRLSLFQGPKHKQSISLRVHSLNTCEVRFSQCGFHTHSHTNTSKEWIRLGSGCQ